MSGMKFLQFVLIEQDILRKKENPQHAVLVKEYHPGKHKISSFRNRFFFIIVYRVYKRFFVLSTGVYTFSEKNFILKQQNLRKLL